MPGAIDRFLQAAAYTPQPDPLLVKQGAYPVRHGRSAWEVPVDRVRPVLDSYYQRSLAITGRRKASGDFSFIGDYFLTNELSYPDVLKDILGTGKVYVGVGKALSFTFPAWQQARHAFAVDFDASIPFGFMPFYGALMAMAPTRAHFVSLLLGRPIDRSRVASQNDLSGQELRLWIERLRFDKVFAQKIEESLISVLGKDIGTDHARQVVRPWLYAFRDFPFLFDHLSNSDGHGRGGLLSSERAYRRERKLFLQGRLTGVMADMATDELQRVMGAIKALGLPLGVLYLSNAEEWVLDDEETARVSKFYGNLRALEKMGAQDSMVISAIELTSPRVFNLKGYIESASPRGLPHEEEVKLTGEFFPLRRAIIRIKDRNLPMSLRLKAAMEGASGAVYRILRDTAAFIGDEPWDKTSFQRKIGKRSPSYGRLPPPARRMFVQNLMELGVVKRPLAQVSRPLAGRTGISGFFRGRVPSSRPVEYQPQFMSAVSADYYSSHAAFIHSMPMVSVIVGGVGLTGAPMLTTAAAL